MHLPRDLLHSLIRLHVLYHASRSSLYGQWMIEELKRHGYNISPGTLYPMLHSMEKRGWLTSTVRQQGKLRRRYYAATRQGRVVLRQAKRMVLELFRELFEEEIEVLKLKR